MTRPLAVALAFAAAFAVAAPARAQTATATAATTTGVSAERFVPGLGPGALLGLDGAAVTGRGQTSFAVGLDFLRDPITLSTVSTSLPISRPVHEQLVGDVALEVGFWKRLAFAVGVPVVLYQDGDRLRGTGSDERPLHAQAAGDLRLKLKALVAGDPARDGLHAALVLQATAPMGGQADFAATDGATIEARIIADWRAGPLTLAATVGVRFERDRALYTTQFGDELTWGAGVGLRLFDRLIGRVIGPAPGNGRNLAGSLMGEAAGAVGPSSGARPIELRGGARLAFGQFSVDAGAGGGVDGSVGAPAWRVFIVGRGTIGRVR